MSHAPCATCSTLPRWPVHILLNLILSTASWGQSSAGPELRVDRTSGFQGNADVGVGPSGNFAVVWSDDGIDISEVFGRFYDASGNAYGLPTQLNGYTPSNQDSPAVAIGPGGRVVVVWQSYQVPGGHSWDIQARLFDHLGQPLGEDFIVNSDTLYSQVDPEVAFDAAGNFLVTWQGARSAPPLDDDIHARGYSASGSPLAPQFAVSTHTSGHQRRPVVAGGSEGEFVIAWDSEGSSGSDDDGLSVQARRVSGTGPVGPEFQVNTVTSGTQSLPGVALGPEGRFTVVWEGPGFDSDFDQGAIVARSFGADGQPTGPDFEINSTTAGYQGAPAVAWSREQGELIVSWESDDVGFDIRARRFDEDLSPMAPDFTVNTYDVNDQSFSAVSMSELTGQLVITWSSTGVPGSPTAEAIVAQRFELVSPVVFADGFESGGPWWWSSWSGGTSPLTTLEVVCELPIFGRCNALTPAPGADPLLPAIGGQMDCRAFATQQDGTVTDVSHRAEWSVQGTGLAGEILVDATGSATWAGAPAGGFDVRAVWGSLSDTASIELIGGSTLVSAQIVDSNSIPVSGLWSGVAAEVGVLGRLVFAGETCPVDLGTSCFLESADPSIVSVIGGGLVGGSLGMTSVSAICGNDIFEQSVETSDRNCEELVISDSRGVKRPFEFAGVGQDIALESHCGSRRVTEASLWTSSNPAVAASVGGGRLRTLGPGTATITTTLDGRSDQVLISVLPFRCLARMEIDEPLSPLARGKTGMLYVWGRYNDGLSVFLKRDQYYLQFSDLTVRTHRRQKGKLGTRFWVPSDAENPLTITAIATTGPLCSLPMQAVAEFEIGDRTTLDLKPRLPTFDLGDPQVLVIEGENDDGSTTVENFDVQFGSSDPTRAYATPDGLIYPGTSVGTVEISGTQDGLVATTQMIVQQGAVVDIKIRGYDAQPALACPNPSDSGAMLDTGLELPAGGYSYPFRVDAFYADDPSFPIDVTPYVTWIHDGVGEIDVLGRTGVTGVVPGSFSLEAHYGGTSDTILGQIIEPSLSSLDAGPSVVLYGGLSGSDSPSYVLPPVLLDDYCVNPVDESWALLPGSPFGLGPRLQDLRDSLHTGTFVVPRTVLEPDRIGSGSFTLSLLSQHEGALADTIQVEVVDDPIVSIEIAPSVATILEGDSVQLRALATTSEGDVVDVTSGHAWNRWIVDQTPVTTIMPHGVLYARPVSEPMIDSVDFCLTTTPPSTAICASDDGGEATITVIPRP